MAPLPTTPGGQFSMSSCPPAPYLQIAPVPNMEVKPAIPVKRSPEDEVQFVSVQPVKKFRGSRDSPSAPPSEQGHGPSSTTPPQDRQAREAQAFNTSSDPAGGGALPTTSEPQAEADMLSRGASLPAMERYVFPMPLQNLDPMRTSHSSPMLSPKQLPPPRLSTQAHHNTGPAGPAGTPAPTASASASALSSTLPPREFHVPWGMAGLYPQPAPINTALSLHRPLLLPPVQPQRIEPPPALQNYEQRRFEHPLPMQHHEDSQTMQQMPEPRPTSHNVVLYGEQQRRSVLEQAQDSQRVLSPQTTEPVTRISQSHVQQAHHTPVQAVSQAMPRHESQTQSQDQTAPAPASAPPQARLQTDTTSNSHSNNSMVAIAQPPVPKPPCLICEQMRQHALFSQANGYPIVPPHMQQGWHGSGPVQQQQQQQHPPQVGVGFAMGSQMPHGFPSKFQVMPVPSGHVPMGYVLPTQGPFQVPIQMQRPVPVPTAAGPGTSEPPAGQQPSSSQFPQFIPSLPQHLHAQYIQAQMPHLQQPTAAARPAAMTGHPQAQASSAHPPPPSTPPAAAQAPGQDAPKTPPQQQPETPQNPSPNLIVDIAETCETVFPWDEVARRHGVTRHKVIETFAAVIQLPLLRCTTDKKRHGKLATNRLREYTKAKKDVEAAKAKSAAATTATTAANATMTPSPSPTSAPPVSPAPSNQESAVLPGVLEMASTMAPLGLPSILTNGLGGQWQPR